MSFLSAALFCVAAATCALGAVSGGAVAAKADPLGDARVDGSCVCDDALGAGGADLFPVKLKPKVSQGFTIEYANTYKVITVFSPDSTPPKNYTTVAYLCGTNPPVWATNDSSIELVSIPVRTAALRTTTHVPFIEYLGQRAALRYVNSAVTALDACLQALWLDKTLVTSSDYSSSALRTSAVANTTLALDLSPGPDVTFSDTWSLTSALAERNSGFKGYSSVVLLREDRDASVIGKLEWLYVVAALFNRETAAVNVVENIRARYECNRDFVAGKRGSAPRPKVLWLTGFGYGTVSCGTHWACALVANAGGDVLNVPAAANLTQFAAQVALADVVIFPQDNFNRVGKYSSAWYTVAMQAAINTTNAVANKMVFDVLSDRLEAWFDAAIAEPDVLLLDLADAFYGDGFVANRPKRFLRNVFLEPVAPQIDSPLDCPDPVAPRYTQWTVGPCATAGGLPTVIPDVLGVSLVDATCSGVTRSPTAFRAGSNGTAVPTSGASASVGGVVAAVMAVAAAVLVA